MFPHKIDLPTQSGARKMCAKRKDWGYNAGFITAKQEPLPLFKQENEFIRQGLALGLLLVARPLANPLGPKRDQQQFSPTNISRSSRVKVTRITKLITKREIALILNQILSTILKRNRWRSVWRICMWILGLKGLRNRIPESGKSLLVRFWILGLGIRNTAQGIRNPTKSGVQVTLTKIRIPVPGIRNRWRGIRNQSLSWITLQ